jgi:RHS repeat-associated protein
LPEKQYVKPKTKHFQAISQASTRTARWPWLFVLGFWQMIRNLIICWFAPRPATQHTIPRRKPMRRSADWELRLTEPRHHWRAIAKILMQANVIVEMRKFMQRAVLKSNSQAMHRQREESRSKSNSCVVLGLSLLLGGSEVFAAEFLNSEFHQKAVADLSTSILNGVARPSAGITDERGIRVSNWQYNSNGKVKRYARAGDVDVHLFSYEGNKTTVTDPLGTVRTYSYQLINDRPYMTQVTQPCSSCGSDASAQTYDSWGLMVSQTDFRGNVTRYERDARALVTSMTRAQGTPVARTQTATYETQWHLPKRVVEPITNGSRITEMAYDAEGNALEEKITVGTEVRTTTRTFNGNGQVLTEDGPRSDVTDLMTMTYDASGNLATKTDAIGHVWRYNSYNADGQLTQMTDPNGLVTTYVYDARQRLSEMTEGTEVTTYDYDDSGNLTKVTLPDASFLSYVFDDADRLIGVEDARGQKMVYTLNGNGDRIKEETFGTGNGLAMTMSRVIDNLGRVESITGSATNEVTTFTYDPNGNEKTTLDPNQNLVKNDFDALNRLTQVTDPDNNPVAFKYDAQDNLVEVSDPRQLKTNYGYSGFDELTKLTSPDTGVTDYSYDLSGNLKTRKDARNITATYQYDALNRIKQISYPAIAGANPLPAEILAFTYDEAAGGAGAKGRLTTAVDGTATTKYQYDDHGRVMSKSQVVGTETAKTQLMSYLPTGQLDQHTLPSGAIVKYSYRADGRVVSIQVNGVTIISELDYFPFGEVKSWKYNTSDRYARSFDTNGRVKGHTAGSATRAISFDPGSRITAIADGTGSANQWTYGYDKLDRLKTAENAATNGAVAGSNLAWTFDATGNRLSEARGTPAVSTSYTIDSASNKLSQVGAVTRGYDSAGNTVSMGTDQSVYSSRNRLVRSTKAGTTADYGYNAFGERVKKTVGGSASQFVYDEEGHVVGEYNATGALVSEYVWLGDVPVAVIKPQAFVASHAGTAAGSSAVFMAHPDHLDTPRVIVNASNQAVWRWDSAPFGETLANEQPTASLASFRFDLRFPGQQFDAETGSHYNYFRDYEAGTGRYLQSDPMGLWDGFGTFSYVHALPVSRSDSVGLGRGRGAGGAQSHPDLKERKEGERTDAILKCDGITYSYPSSGHGHVEEIAARIIKASKSGSGTLFINYKTGPCNRCLDNVPPLLDPGNRLDVVFPDGWGTFTSGGWSLGGKF